ncbi:hypothetical protein X737_26090 [Mesorhizobium sp. L48C026A00]|nr:hypothetical protein X737_26090 [Mesorhizobium sp. L48C026A00]
MVLISGEPGIGKSRLIAALEERVAGEAHLRLKYFCSPHHRDSALQPVIARWQNDAGFVRSESADARLDKLEALLLPFGATREEVTLIAELLGVPGGERYPPLALSPERKKEQTFGALNRILDERSRRSPVLILFEDAHWADPSSLELLDRLIMRVASLPVMVIISFRPEFHAPWVGQASVTLMALSRLGPRQATTLASQVVIGQTLPAGMLERIVAQTDGVPLFIEELTKAVLERASQPDSLGSALSVPSTLQASLMARLDRLPSAKQVAQIGAVIGREFSHELLVTVAEIPEAVLTQGLDELVSAGLAFRRGTPPEGIYSFKHALVQDAAYVSLLRSTRQKLHSRIARVLEERWPDVFKDLSADKSLGYLGEGVANDVIAILSRFSDIAVVSRPSSFAYQGKEGDIRQIGKELDVGYVLEGSVRKEGNRVRIVAQLINANTGDHVWADRFDKAGSDPWALQDELTGKIVGAMTGEFGAIRKSDYSQAWGKDSTNLAEYDYYLRAESQLNLYTKEGIERSGEISRDGLQVFPGSPLLTVELGWSHWLKVALFYSSDPQADLQEAERLVNQVLSNKNLSPQVARLAHWLHAWLLTVKGDHDRAVAEMNKAIAAAPYNAFTLTDAGSIFLQAGQPEKALELTDAAAARDPGLSWFFNYVRGFIFIVLGKNEEAVEVLKTTEFADAPLQLAIAYMRLGRQADARAAVEKMLKSTPGVTIQSWRHAWNFRDPSILDQAAADLARAGLPGSPTQ